MLYSLCSYLTINLQSLQLVKLMAGIYSANLSPVMTASHSVVLLEHPVVKGKGVGDERVVYGDEQDLDSSNIIPLSSFCAPVGLLEAPSENSHPFGGATNIISLSERLIASGDCLTG